LGAGMNSATSRAGGIHDKEQISRTIFLGAPFDHVEFGEVLELLRHSEADDAFRYVVTPNVDHVVRLDRSKELSKLYDRAWLSLCDSRPIGILARCLSLKLTHVTGSGLTVAIFRSVVRPGDRIALIAANEAIVSDVRAGFPHVEIRAHIPPMNVSADRAAFQQCIDFVTEGRDRFVFLAIGSPQSEKMAFEISRDPNARGVGFCIGAGLEFLVGRKKRAPGWVQGMGMEWLHRMLSEPRRLWRRYMSSMLPLARLFISELRTKRT
jgi:N-acetylglucosaminyldiphosphoundecaprenol N-acetyl-beta-D-mannosaminyltransferase